MKKILPKESIISNCRVRAKKNFSFTLFYSTILLVTALSLCFTYPSKVDAQEAIPEVSLSPTSVSARVGEFHLNVSGFISPYASVIMTSDNIFLRATVADRYGMFSFIDVLINKGFSHFCLEAVDFKRIGTSYTCFNFKPATGDITMKDLFLPPTLGLSRTEIAENSEAIAFGYTMPGAVVTIHLNNGKTLTTYADSTGYYEFHLKGLKAGKYELYTTAKYENKESLVPTRVLHLRSLSWWQQIVAFLLDLWRKFAKLLTSVYLNPLWIAIPILISIIILVLKIWPERFTFIYNSKLLAILPGFKKKKLLHHGWFIGY